MAATLGWVRTSRSKNDHRAYRSATIALCGVKLGESPIWINRTTQGCDECRVRDPERAEFIEFLIEYLSDAGDMRAPTARPDSVRLSGKFFDGAEPFLRTDLTHGGEESIAGAKITDVTWPLDVRIITRLGEEDGLDAREQQEEAQGWHPGWHLERWRSMTPKEVRGRVSPSLPYPMEYTLGFPVQGEVYRYILGNLGPERWVDIRSNSHMRVGTISSSLQRFFNERAMLGVGLWKIKTEQWRVYFSLDDRPGIELPTDPTGARAAFRLRDIPDGSKRRAALRHWVAEHWRQHRSDPSEEIKVREHLAGASRFAWSGLNCRITPSRVDLARELEAVEQRAEDRATGTDRRKRQSSLKGR